MPVYIEGGPEFIRALRDAGADMKDMTAANKAASSTVANLARVLAPKRSGKLAAAIRAGGNQKIAYVNYGKKSVPYAGPIHWGWKARNIEANEYVSRAAQYSEPQWINAYRKRVDQIIEKVESST